jgi:predicted MPP superfamily phosphohydrolase
MSVFGLLLLFFGVSQVYWAWRGYRLAKRLIPSTQRRLLAVAAVLATYFFAFAYNRGGLGREGTPVHLTWGQAFLAAPFLWWAASSVFAFLVVILFAIPKTAVAASRRIAAAIRAGAGKANLESPGRRHFLERTTNVAAAAPFIAGAYGLLYGRLNLQVTNQTVHLDRLPRSLDGFRIAQLSDIHIGPFMPAEEIRKYVAIANQLKPDLIVLTGDFVTFDPDTQQTVVEALSGLRAPFGIFGCLGNHDAWAGVEDSITALFRRTGVRILRAESVSITPPNGPISAADRESFNLIGVDFQSRHRFGPSAPVRNILGNIEGLIDHDRVNILLSHNPDTFDRAAELGIDLSLAGHTHGGQAALEFISPQIAPSRLVTPYVAGWFRKPGGRLYVNRGIGTIGIPIRIGAPPEITVYQLVRA